MEARREQAVVGLFVIIVAALLLATIIALTGAFSHGGSKYTAFFGFAGGIEPGAAVRYAGGPQVGRVDKVQSDPQNPTRMEIDFHVRPDTPVKTDSTIKISTLNALGENFIEIVPGTQRAPLAPSGTTLKSTEYAGFDQLTTNLNQLAPQIQELVQNLNSRVIELKDTISRVNDLINPQNRQNLSASLGHVRGMLEEDRPKIKSTLTHIDSASAKMGPMLDDFKKTIAQAQDALAHIDGMIVDNRPDVRQSIIELRQALASADSLTDQLDRTMNVNSDNFDEILDNMRHITENLKQFTETIKTRPYTLIRSSSPPPHQPGQTPKP
jgi:phospholipid/cholesterol/gamma-HCH transport system substrate-binding protein